MAKAASTSAAPASPRATPRLPAAQFRPAASRSPCCRRPSGSRCARRPPRSRPCRRRSASTLPQKPKTSAAKDGAHRAVARAGRMAGHRRGRQGSARRLRRRQGAAFGRRHLAPQRRHLGHRAGAPRRRVNAGCPQDLSLDAFPVGACSRTILGKVEIVLLRTAEDAFRVECWRSFSDYVWAFLTEAAKDAAA